MRLVWTDAAWEDYLHWQATDRQVLERVNALLKDAARSPFRGIGKP
ncbi:MAG TPA: type II toxin-antitoxin system YoeB family toxin, partial [Stellaceae bacterium]|nr:type II toxin-antitoxin system YoeB family toxin [Stellaceae bacterium]